MMGLNCGGSQISRIGHAFFFMFVMSVPPMPRLRDAISKLGSGQKLLAASELSTVSRSDGGPFQ